MRVSENFTLEQVVVLVSITIVIVAVTLFSLDPLVQLRSARNRERWSELQTLGSALRAYEKEHGRLPMMVDVVSETVQVIGEANEESWNACETVRCRGEQVAPFACQTTGLLLELQPFLASLPMDPLRGTVERTGYFVNTSDHGAIILGACDEEAEDIEGSALPPRIQVAW